MSCRNLRGHVTEASLEPEPPPSESFFASGGAGTMFVFCSKNWLPASLKRCTLISASTPLAHVRDISSSSVRMSKGTWSVPTPLTTLNPAHLEASDFRLLAHKLNFTMRSTPMNASTKPIVTYKVSQGVQLPFPPDANGFFYFHPGPPHAPIAGTLRFRVVPSGSPTDFENGYDLLSANNRLPWSIHLPSLANHHRYASLISLLVHDPPPVAPPLLDLLKRNQIPALQSSAIIVHSMGQPLYHDLDKPHVVYKIAEGYALSKKFTPHLPRDGRARGSGDGYSPYDGMFDLCQRQILAVKSLTRDASRRFDRLCF
jgi:hypothetical protein